MVKEGVGKGGKGGEGLAHKCELIAADAGVGFLALA